MAFLEVYQSFVSVHAWNVVAAFAFILVLTVLANLLQQTLPQKSKEPPGVFPWLSFFGSTVTYRIDPYQIQFPVPSQGACLRSR